MSNEKLVAMIVLLCLGIGSYIAVPTQAKEIVLPIITGIAGFITGNVVAEGSKT
jgi:hypothetical protein